MSFTGLPAEPLGFSGCAIEAKGRRGCELGNLCVRVGMVLDCAFIGLREEGASGEETYETGRKVWNGADSADMVIVAIKLFTQGKGHGTKFMNGVKHPQRI